MYLSNTVHSFCHPVRMCTIREKPEIFGELSQFWRTQGENRQFSPRLLSVKEIDTYSGMPQGSSTQVGGQTLEGRQIKLRFKTMLQKYCCKLVQVFVDSVFLMLRDCTEYCKEESIMFLFLMLPTNSYLDSISTTEMPPGIYWGCPTMVLPPIDIPRDQPPWITHPVHLVYMLSYTALYLTYILMLC